MKPQLLFVSFALVLLYDTTFAQIMPCGTNLPVLSDNVTRNCEIMDRGKCHKIMLVVTGFPGANGYGASVASRNYAKGEYIECHIQIRRGEAVLICREYYKVNKTKTGETFQVELGNRVHIDSVMIAISRRMVKVTLNKHTKEAPIGKKQANSMKKHTMRAKIPYVIEAIFPIREQSGFCSRKRIHYKPNGLVHARKERDKANYGYFVSVYMSPF